MTTGILQLTLSEVGRGPASLDGLTLTGIVVTSAYSFLPNHTTADDVTAFETDATYTRPTGTATATEDPDLYAWFVTLDDITTDTDLTDEPAMGGIAWFRPGATDADRLYVGYSVDTTGTGNPTYSPTYDGGFYDLSPYELITITVDGGEL